MTVVFRILYSRALMKALDAGKRDDWDGCFEPFYTRSCKCFHQATSKHSQADT